MIPKMRAIPELVSAPLNTVPIEEQFRWSHPPQNGDTVKYKEIAAHVTLIYSTLPCVKIFSRSTSVQYLWY